MQSNNPGTKNPETTSSTGAKSITKTNSLAIVSLVLAFFIPLAGLITALTAMSQIKKRGEGGKGIATAGLIISIVVLITHIGLILMIVILTVVNLGDTRRDNIREADAKRLVAQIEDDYTSKDSRPPVLDFSLQKSVDKLASFDDPATRAEYVVTITTSMPSRAGQMSYYSPASCENNTIKPLYTASLRDSFAVAVYQESGKVLCVDNQ